MDVSIKNHVKNLQSKAELTQKDILDLKTMSKPGYLDRDPCGF